MHKVLYILNNAPDYRDKFLRELGKHVDLTVAAYAGAEHNLKDPAIRVNYRFVQLKRMRVAGVNLNPEELLLAREDYDCIIIGFVLNSPFRLMNIFRKRKVLAAGLIFGQSENFFISLVRKFLLERVDAVLVYTDLVKSKLERQISNRIISFNNTYFSASEINPVKLPELKSGKLNVIWVGRYQARKKIERLYELAKRDSRLNVRVVGPGIVEAFSHHEPLPNFSSYGAAHGEALLEHFEWCHMVFNPGGAGLLIMNAARLGRSIVIDVDSHHGPEIQLAIDAQQDFIDFSKNEVVEEYISGVLDDPRVLEDKADLMLKCMRNYTIEHMVKKYLEAIVYE